MEKYVADVPLSHRKYGYLRLEIVPASEDNTDGGWLLLLFKTEVGCHDDWYESLEEAFDAGEGLGVNPGDWRTIERP